MYKKILVPLDGSRTAQKGLREAIKLAKHHNASLRVLHVIDEFVATPDIASSLDVARIHAYSHGVGKKLLDAAIALARKHNLRVDSAMLEIVASRSAADIIGEQARKWKADVLVIGTHGRRGISRLVMGSDAEEIVRTSRIPVLMVPSRMAGR